jgi:hypothetical protein
MNTLNIITMNIVTNINQYNTDYVYFCEPIKNNIMNGQFIRILYSAQLFVLNGIYIQLCIAPLSFEKYFNKYKYTFDINIYATMIASIQTIEEEILHKIMIKDKTPQRKIYEQLKMGNIKIFSENIDKNNNNIVLLKIAGIWETANEYGLTYKFIK